MKLNKYNISILYLRIQRCKTIDPVKMRQQKPSARAIWPPEGSAPLLVESCVIRTVEEAARRANGFIFVPGSKRVMSVDDVNRIASLLNERLLPNQKRPSLPLDETEGMEMEMWMEIAPWFTTDAQSIDYPDRSLWANLKTRRWRWCERQRRVCQLMLYISWGRSRSSLRAGLAPLSSRLLVWVGERMRGKETEVSFYSGWFCCRQRQRRHEWRDVKDLRLDESEGIDA
jgi:hypothetical protein